ncbi:MAG: family 43 glycosylhydrolase [Flavisolibacter sp.]|jgi:GH43 family beta-xylosidase|nr:family 43 glycosylhydrolase [Flavisolibacter sp.]
MINKFLSKNLLITFFISSSLLINVSCKKGGGDNGGGGTNPLPAGNTFTNPLLPSGPDPYVIKKDNIYYYTHTLGNRIGLWKTTAMSKLASAPYLTVFTPLSISNHKENLWAPEMFFINNKWYIYYTAGDGSSVAGDPFATQRTYVLENSSADPTTGTWLDKARIYDAANDFWAIDGTVLEYNGTNYFIWSGRAAAVNDKQNIYIAKMADPWTITGSRTLLSTPTFSWETQGDPDVNEAPEILKNPAGKVFMVYSASGCWTDEYGLGMLTLKDGGNPLVATDWTKSTTPVFQKSPANNVYGPGHNSFFTSPNGSENWIIYHANAAPMNGNGCGDARSPRMQKFTFNSDGTPNFGTPVRTNTPITVPAGE